MRSLTDAEIIAGFDPSVRSHIVWEVCECGRDSLAHQLDDETGEEIPPADCTGWALAFTTVDGRRFAPVR